MVKIKIWGPITWNLLHTIAEKVYSDRFQYAKNDIIKIIKLIINSIPCPICREHASIYLKRHNINNCNDRLALIEYLFEFHNNTNLAAKNEVFDKNILQKYVNYNFNATLNTYMTYYKNTKSDDLKFSFNKMVNLKVIFSLLVANTKNFTC